MPRAFLYTLAGVNLCLAAAGAVYAGREGIPANIATPIVAAFLLQVSFYLVPGFPAVRAWFEERLSPVRIAWLLVAGALAPYLVYALPTGVFQAGAALKLLGIAFVPAFVFVVWPPGRRGLTWQDLAVMGTVAAVELGRVFRQIYLSPIDDLRLDILGRIMILGVSATAFLSLRGLEGSGYRLPMTRQDWAAGVKYFLMFLPVGVPAGVVIGFAGYRPVKVEGWMYPVLIAGTFLGMYAVVALFEEFFFRGGLQNLVTQRLGHPLAAQALASVAFGLVHLPFRAFPNWRFAVLATIAGWFYGQAYRESRSVVASSITHALVNTVWRLLFAG